MRFGAGLWCLQATASTPRPHAKAYREIVQDAVELERLGYESLWLSEHHFFYDGYCPAPLPVAAGLLSATKNLRVGTGMLLLPMADSERVAEQAASIARRHGARFDLGVGLGYRDVEFDGKGVERRTRVARHKEGLGRIAEIAEPAGVTVWNGSATPAGVARAGARGQGVLLSGGNPLSLVRDLAAGHRQGWEDAGRPGVVRPRVAALRNVWLADEAAEKAAALDFQRASYVLYAGLGWSVAAQGDNPAMDFRADVDRAIQDAVATTIAGSAIEVEAGLREVAAAGVDDVIFRVVLEGAPQHAVHHVLGRLAAEVLPALRDLESDAVKIDEPVTTTSGSAQ